MRTASDRVRGPLAASVLLLFAWAALGAAAAPAVHKTTLQTSDFPGSGRHSLLVRTLVDASGDVPPHTHPGLELAYIESGKALVRISGRPDRTLGPGGSFAVPPATPHAVRNLGSGVLTIVSTYVVDPSKPIASPVKP